MVQSLDSRHVAAKRIGHSLRRGGGGLAGRVVVDQRQLQRVLPRLHGGQVPQREAVEHRLQLLNVVFL